MKRQHFEIRRHWLFAVVCLGFFTFIGLADASKTYIRYANVGDPIYWWQALGMGLSFWYSWALLFFVAYILVRRYPIGSKHIALPSMVYLAAGVLFALLKITMDYPVIRTFYCPQPHLLTFPKFFSMAFVGQFQPDVLISWIFIGLAHALEYHRRYRHRELMTAQLEGKLAQAQLQILKMQVQPSLLLSTLQGISAKVHQDAEVADAMVARLGDLLRLTLDNADAEQVALRAELEGLEAYLGIEQARFGPSFQAMTDVDPELLDAQVPLFLLQPVVEEAIRHTLGGQESPGRVTVRARCLEGVLRLQVEAEAFGLQGFQKETGANGKGLAHTRARLRQIYGKHFSLLASNGTPGRYQIVIQLPFEEMALA
ncbi:MAG: sensor histidine kinase [Gemmataceae bacterium]